jgi:hypothetical protein
MPTDAASVVIVALFALFAGVVAYIIRPYYISTSAASAGWWRGDGEARTGVRYRLFSHDRKLPFGLWSGRAGRSLASRSAARRRKGRAQGRAPLGVAGARWRRRRSCANMSKAKDELAKYAERSRTSVGWRDTLGRAIPNSRYRREWATAGRCIGRRRRRPGPLCCDAPLSSSRGAPIHQLAPPRAGLFRFG